MDFEEFKEFVENTKKQHPVWFGLPSDSQSTEESIMFAEKKMDAVFPNQYKEFLKEYGGGYFGFTVIYSLDDASDWNLINKNEENNHIRSDFLIFSENELGDFFGFHIDNGKCGPSLYFFDHETQKWSETKFVSFIQYVEKKGLSS